MLRVAVVVVLAVSLLACGGGKAQELHGSITAFVSIATTARCGAITAATVIVRDEKNAIIATGTTGSADTKTAGSCEATFTVMVPKRQFYVFDVGGYHSEPYEYGKLKGDGWYLSLIWI